MTIRVEHDPALFDFQLIVPFVQNAYWGQGRDAADIRAAFAGSACIGLFEGDQQLACARAMTDGVFHAYIYDLIVFEPCRGRGLSRTLIEALFAHPKLSRVTGWMLSTRDAHGLYENYGFEPVDPGRVMRMRKR